MAKNNFSRNKNRLFSRGLRRDILKGFFSQIAVLSHKDALVRVVSDVVVGQLASGRVHDTGGQEEVVVLQAQKDVYFPAADSVPILC